MLRSWRTDQAAADNEKNTRRRHSRTRPNGTPSLSKLAGDVHRFCKRLNGQGSSQPTVDQAIAKPQTAASVFVPRHGEAEGVYFRSNRLFTANHEWYFATREGENKGPYPSRQHAEVALAIFIAERQLDKNSCSVAQRRTDT